MDAIGASGFDDFIVRINSDPQPDYAALFPVVQAEADCGEQTATAVLKSAGIELAYVTGTVLRRLFSNLENSPAASGGATLKNISVALHGGVLANSPQMREALEDILRSQFPQGRLAQCLVDPARGALNRARKETLSCGVTC